jgi:XTP/dITP diphosphohydrolase
MELTKIVVASGNKAKIKEIKQIFKEYEIVDMQELGFSGDIEETGKTFKENAKIKAEFISKMFSLPTLADDSGLCVDALGGAPGVYSARFSGEGEEANRKLLLKRLAGLSDRSAYFESAVCLYFPNGKTLFGEGRTYGKILTEEIGTNGFGYDPLFFSNDLKKSFGLATDKEKNSVSHRYRALCDLREKL